MESWENQIYLRRDLEFGMERSEASSSAVNLRKQRLEPKKLQKKRQQMGEEARRKEHLFSMTRSAPWTPLPRRLGAYSDKSTCRSHSITLGKKSWVRGGGTRSGDLRHLSGGTQRFSAWANSLGEMGRCWGETGKAGDGRRVCGKHEIMSGSKIYL